MKFQNLLVKTAFLFFISSLFVGCASLENDYVNDANNLGKIEDNGMVTHTVSLAWMPPTTYENGDSLTSLAGYKIYYGNQSGKYTQTVDVPLSGVTEYVLTDLYSDTYYFVITAYTENGLESLHSEEAYISL